MFRTILVPLDGSRLAEEALATAIATARRSGATLQLAMVHHPVMPSADSAAMTSAFTELDRLAHEGEKRYLTHVAGGSGVRPTWSFTPPSSRGQSPSGSTHATSLSADLVVMTTTAGRGQPHVARQRADELLRHLPCPPAAAASGAGPAQWAERLPPILVPLDGSAGARLSSSRRSPCAPLGAHYSLLGSTRPGARGAGRGRAAASRPDVIEGERRRAAAYLDRIADRLEARGCQVSTQVIVGDAPARVIIEQGNPAVVDCIALATRGAAGVKRLLLGSVTDKVVRGAEVPVLALHPPHPDDASTRASAAAQSAEGLSREGVAIGG
jgi:nucleotide-binding universal stress UspA family protein